jgi:hypothetical protein
MRDRRSTEWHRAFTDLAPMALVAHGHLEPVPAGIGDNRVVWPIKLGTSGRWERLDSLSKEVERFHPVFPYRYWFRIWTLSGEAASSLAYALSNAIADRIERPAEPFSESAPIDRLIAYYSREGRVLKTGERLRNGYEDIGASFDLPSINSDHIRKGLELGAPQTSAEAREQYYAVIRVKLEIAVHQLAGDNCIQAWDDEGFAAHVDGLVMKRAQRAAGGRP